MAAELKIARGFALPLDAVGQVTAILGKRDAGKSNTAKVFAEGVLRAGVQVVVLDPVGHWWGLRSLFEIAVLGGPMGDLPLEPTAGKLIADVVVESGQSLVIDVSGFETNGEMERFVYEFATRLYRLKQATPTLMLLVLEEADEFAPQDTRGKGVPEMVGAWARIAKRGRGRGMGLLAVTLRSAALSKNVLNQTDTLIAMQTTAPLDMKAIKEWVAYQQLVDPGEVIPSLPHLGRGEAWIWRPGAHILKKVQVAKARSLDTSATPSATLTVEDARKRSREMKPIDLAVLGKRIEETVERVKENDPVELRGRIATLERKLAAAGASVPPTAREIAESLRRETLPAAPPGTEWELGDWMGPTPQAPWPRLRVPKPEPEVVEVPVLTEETLARVGRFVDSVTEAQGQLGDSYEALREVLAPLDYNVKHALGEAGRAALTEGQRALIARVKDARPADPPRPGTTSRRPPEPQAQKNRPPAESRSAPGAAPEPGASGGASSNGALDTAARHFLTTLARHHPMRVSVGQLGVLARRKTRGGSFNSAMKQLRENGYIADEAGLIVLTDSGLEASGVTPRPLSPSEVIEQWREVLPLAAREVFDVLSVAWPDALPVAEVAERTGRQPRGGSWNAAISTLLKNGLAERHSNGLRLTNMVMATGLAEATGAV